MTAICFEKKTSPYIFWLLSGDWGTCFATASESRDPNRLHWLLETLMEEPLRSRGSFLDSSRLYVLQGAMAQQEWRVG